MTDITDEANEFVESYTVKFIECYSKALEKCERKFLTTFQIWCYALDNFTDEQILYLLPKSMDILSVDNRIKHFKEIVSTWKQVVTEAQTEVINTIMSTENVSQGEAMLLADNYYDEQIGYFSSFSKCLMSAILVLVKEVKENYG